MTSLGKSSAPRNAAIAAASCLVLVSLCPPAMAGGPEPRHVYAISIGYNGAPSFSGGASRLEPLRFADDDAVAFADFTRAFARRNELLSVLDSDTEKRLGTLIPAARPPSGAELRRVVASIRNEIEIDNAAGIESVVLIYYSGHGVVGDGNVPALTLMDEPLTQRMLYDEVIAALPARHLHLIVDACHAEAVVRPRDGQAALVGVAKEELRTYAMQTTLDRFPNVGAIIGATRSAQAHEWDIYQGGVFTHEVLSGLRGAADVNHDGRIEYSELAAFLSAANRDVRDPRAHVEAITKPPSSNPREPIVDLTSGPRTEATLFADTPRFGSFFIEDESGTRLADVRAELGHAMRIVVPARKLYVRFAKTEASIEPHAGQTIALEDLMREPIAGRSRGALDSALHDGLFTTPFGPAYYSGFVDQSHDLVPVPLAAEPEEPIEAPRTPPAGSSLMRTVGFTSIGAGAALAASSAVFGVLAWTAHREFENAQFERPAWEAADRYTSDLHAAAWLAAGAGVAVAAGVLLVTRAGPPAPHPIPTASAPPSGFGISASGFQFSF